MMKTRGKSKIFKCLRPATTDDGLFKQSKLSSSNFDGAKTGRCYSSSESEYEGGGGGGRRGGGGSAAAGYPKLLKLLSGKSEPSDDPSVRKGKYRGKFSRVLKAVFFEASLSRKSRKADSSFQLGSAMSRSSSNKSTKLQKVSHSRNESFSSSKGFTDVVNKVSSRINSECSSQLQLSSSSFSTAVRDNSASSTSSSASSSSLSRSTSERKKQFSQEQKSVSSRTKKYTGFNVGWCCLILCLLVLVVCGKAFAIVCISAWLYFAPICFRSAGFLLAED